ncbi:FMN-dependent oxidoreductase, nitrilotriacetate monooxygenase family [Cohnella sp. OV330]|uniref:LLM class flavin-dependent oxidoreductase n=1 Tax=Cohnella sp. OV330 TaxID=1855288 RepID=UPI0008E3ED01|nr:LLM class flavin-dependent oxidoreductase [Cohnella sp. OV330]SFB02439.1 FMN-dependent oxidoreductase, nitrilotriacetate monooxygenase family [Cohnella sp. OV330]
MGKRIRLQFIEKNCPTVDNIGMWTHPDSKPELYNQLDYWVSLARTLEKARFDGIFFADALGTFSTYGNSRDTAVREGMSLPINDPMYLVPAMAAVTEHLGFAVTGSLTYDHPYAMARKMSTLDHLTGGRIGWNIVTSNLDSAARNYGLDAQLEHDRRYDRGDEFLEACYKLWERSWEEDAVVRDRTRVVYAEPAKVHDIGHRGEFFSVPGIHLCEPSPQRTPVLFQAGSSQRGRRFAARHAECVFLNAMTPEETKLLVDDVRAKAEEEGRDPADLLFFPRFVPVVAPTEAEAKEKFESYLAHVSTEGTLALLSSWSGIDFSRFGRDELLAFIERKGNGSQYISDYLARVSTERPLTVPDLARLYAFGGIENVSVGSPRQIAERMISFADYTGVDGFNIAYAIRPDSIGDFARLVVPELQRAGRVQTEYRPGTLRAKLLGGGDRLAAAHRGARVEIG